MGNQPEDKVFTKKGVAIGVLFFSIYDVILFSLDPEWVLWAWPMAMGALYVPESPPPLFADPRAAFEMGLLFNFLSFVAVTFLMVIMREPGLAWLSWVKARLREWGSQGARESRERAEVEEPMPAGEAKVRRAA